MPKQPKQEPWYLVVWMDETPEHTSDYAAYHECDLEDAKKFYQTQIEKGCYSVSLCRVLESTDYF